MLTEKDLVLARNGMVAQEVLGVDHMVVAHVAHPVDWTMLEGLTIVPCLPVAHAVANVLRWWFPLSTKPNLLLGDWSIVMNGLPPTVHHSCIELCNNCLEQNQMTARPFRPEARECQIVVQQCTNV